MIGGEEKRRLDRGKFKFRQLACLGGTKIRDALETVKGTIKQSGSVKYFS